MSAPQSPRHLSSAQRIARTRYTGRCLGCGQSEMTCNCDDDPTEPDLRDRQAHLDQHPPLDLRPTRAEAEADEQ